MIRMFNLFKKMKKNKKITNINDNRPSSIKNINNSEFESLIRKINKYEINEKEFIDAVNKIKNQIYIIRIFKVNKEIIPTTIPPLLSFFLPKTIAAIAQGIQTIGIHIVSIAITANTIDALLLLLFFFTSSTLLPQLEQKLSVSFNSLPHFLQYITTSPIHNLS